MRNHLLLLLPLFLQFWRWTMAAAWMSSSSMMHNNNKDYCRRRTMSRHKPTTAIITTSSPWHPTYNKGNTVRTTASTTRLYSSSSSTDAEIVGKEKEETDQSLSIVNSNSPTTTMTQPQSQADIPTTTTTANNVLPRGKVNEIDFCIAPADVSLSRAYANFNVMGNNNNRNNNNNNEITSSIPATNDDTAAAVGLSLTRALNNASNRAVRRILLARSWPSAEALNKSLRQMAALEQQQKTNNNNNNNNASTAKCPVPRPILNVLTRNSNTNTNQKDAATISSSSDIEIDDTQVDVPNKKKMINLVRLPKPRSRTDEEYVADQIQSFRNAYGMLPGYSYAEEYLECVLSLATSGYESEKVRDVLAHGIYDEAYKRVLSVLKSVGVEFEIVEAATGKDDKEDVRKKQRRIASKLKDQDICWSLLDKIEIRKESKQQQKNRERTNGIAVNLDAQQTSQITDDANTKKKNNFRFWQKNVNSDSVNETNENSEELTGEDLGGLLLSAKEPTMTRQLNVLSNIVLRALLFGGDQELLVLAETLDADRAAFIDRWYPGTSKTTTENEERPGIQYLNCLVLLLRKCYNDGLVTDMNPPLKLRGGYANSYERLVASAVERGSGYIKPMVGGDNVALVTSMPKPRTAQEELGRFAVWETNFRQAAAATQAKSKSPKFTPYPEDLVGTWEVRDVIGGETIGKSIVTFREGGDVQVEQPLEGLRWRLDPGPTHLDTCTFQVLSTLDGTILQYRGFIDRGARLEARFSKRPISIRGSVMFQMRDGSIDYFKDMLPINYRTGTTKFIMTKSD